MTQIQQKQPYQKPIFVSFRDTYAPTAKKHFPTAPKTRSFRELNKKIFKFNSPVFIIQKEWYFYLILAKTTLSDTFDAMFQKHVCTDFRKI